MAAHLRCWNCDQDLPSPPFSRWQKRQPPGREAQLVTCRNCGWRYRLDLDGGPAGRSPRAIQPGQDVPRSALTGSGSTVGASDSRTTRRRKPRNSSRSWVEEATARPELAAVLADARRRVPCHTYRTPQRRSTFRHEDLLRAVERANPAVRRVGEAHARNQKPRRHAAPRAPSTRRRQTLQEMARAERSEEPRPRIRMIDRVFPGRRGRQNGSSYLSTVRIQSWARHGQRPGELPQL